MSRLLSLGILCLTLSACASSQVRQPASIRSAANAHVDIGSSINSGVQAEKTLEYQALRADITSLHASSMFNETDPRIFNVSVIDNYPAEFGRANCSKLSSSSCQEKFSRFVMLKLSQRYFAADMTRIEQTCADEPLICGDLNTLETLFRRLHNSSIQESEREKLGLIEEWRQDKLTDDQLRSALHIDFKLQNGKVILTLPSA